MHKPSLGIPSAKQASPGILGEAFSINSLWIAFNGGCRRDHLPSPDDKPSWPIAPRYAIAVERRLASRHDEGRDTKRHSRAARADIPMLDPKDYLAETMLGWPAVRKIAKAIIYLDHRDAIRFDRIAQREASGAKHQGREDRLHGSTR